MPNAIVVEIPDVREPWSFTFKDLLHTEFSGALSIHVQGELDGEATLHTHSGDIIMPPGLVDRTLYQEEAWANTFKVDYMPKGVAQGELTIRVGLGSNALREWRIKD